MAAAGVPVSLGVDGVASNESGSMTHEANFAWLVHRAAHGAAATTAEEVLHWGTQGGARVLGLNAVGTLEPVAADLVLYDVSGPRFNGFHDYAIAPVAAGGRAGEVQHRERPRRGGQRRDSGPRAALRREAVDAVRQLLD